MYPGIPAKPPCSSTSIYLGSSGYLGSATDCSKVSGQLKYPGGGRQSHTLVEPDQPVSGRMTARCLPIRAKLCIRVSGGNHVSRYPGNNGYLGFKEFGFTWVSGQNHLAAACQSIRAVQATQAASLTAPKYPGNLKYPGGVTSHLVST